MDVFLHALTSYFVIIDPIGAALIFHGLSEGRGGAYELRMALRAVLISMAIVLLFGFFGEALLTRLGISIEALRVAGGLLLFYTAFHMITQPASGSVKAAVYDLDISVYPMSIPLIAGPGCLTLTILLFSGPEGQAHRWPLLAAVVLIYALTFVLLLASRSIKALVGKTGDDILRRLLGVLLAALAIQFVADGIRQIAAWQST